ncbi:MAG: hypothetical protein M1160_01975 [Candidatus Marsarchaeota archaeon]|nr:hypothetical protein [Candidatus Marsarchaeota archaeon]MCL5111630.1 hypothetical protein [Candidatus Marsarchaeota archaeon]
MDIQASFEPQTLKAYSKNEPYLVLSLKSSDGSAYYWCECDVSVKPPLSLAHDKELNTGRTKVGIVKPNGAISKRIRLFTMPNNFPDDYNVSITAYVYGEDGAIAERADRSVSVPCIE